MFRKWIIWCSFNKTFLSKCLSQSNESPLSLHFLGGADFECGEGMMGFHKDPCYGLLFYICIGFCLAPQCFTNEVHADQTAELTVNASDAAGRSIPETLFGIFFEVRSLSLSYASFLSLDDPPFYFL